MPGSNGSEEERTKKCPLDKECAMCMWNIEMANKVLNELSQKFGMCALVAAVTMLSEINMKTQMPQQKIKLPNQLRG